MAVSLQGANVPFAQSCFNIPAPLNDEHRASIKKAAGIFENIDIAPDSFRNMLPHFWVRISPFTTCTKAHIFAGGSFSSLPLVKQSNEQFCTMGSLRRALEQVVLHHS